MATLKEVAKRAGVSLGTASAVFNNKEWVKPEIRKRVLKAAEEINYQPNLLARSLKTRKSNTIGVIVSDITNPFFPEIFSAIELRARIAGYNLLLSNANENKRVGSKAFLSLQTNQVDGIIIIGGQVPEEVILSSLNQRKLPVILIEGKYTSPEIDSINVDSVKGGFIATSHLLNSGYWPVGFLNGNTENHQGNANYSGKGRFQGYLSALEDAGKALDEKFLYSGNFRFDGGYKAMENCIQNNITPRALFAANDLMAIGAMEAAKAARLRIPEDIAFVGYDDIPSAAYCSPSLTTVPLPKQKMGELAIEKLTEKLSQGSTDCTHVLLPPGDLKIRQSCSSE